MRVRVFLAGWLALALEPACALALPVKVQEYCACTCGAVQVLVTPGAGVSPSTCKAMNKKYCSVNGGATWDVLKCSGGTAVASGISLPGPPAPTHIKPGQPPSKHGILLTPVPTRPPAAR